MTEEDEVHGCFLSRSKDSDAGAQRDKSSAYGIAVTSCFKLLNCSGSGPVWLRLCKTDCGAATDLVHFGSLHRSRHKKTQTSVD